MPEILKRLLPGNEAERLLDRNTQLSHEINERMSEAAGEVTRLRGCAPTGTTQTGRFPSL